MSFQKSDFYWGISSSAPQTEGAASEEGRGPSIWDTFAAGRKKIAGRHTPETACDFYHRYESDLDLLQAMGIPNFRTSISWSRILPAGKGMINQSGLDFYDRLTDACLARNITPWFTLYHWDLPQALEDCGGWTNRDVVSYFSDYCKLVLDRLGDRVKHWMALNEPLVFTGVGYFLGLHAPGKKGMRNFLPAMHHAALAQAEGIRMIQDRNTGLKAGTTFSCSWITPYTSSEKDMEAAVRASKLMNELFLDLLTGRGYPIDVLPFLQRVEKFMKAGDEVRLQANPDFIGIQNYTREVIRYSWLTPYLKARIVDARLRKVKHTQMNWEVYPESLYHLLMRYSSYPEIKSIIVTENGAAFPDVRQMDGIHDAERCLYLHDYIAEVKRARQEGAKVDGYFAWSFTDNFEWAEGYFPRFGLIHIDYAKQHRTIKDSGLWYAEMVRQEEDGQNRHELSRERPPQHYAL